MLKCESKSNFLQEIGAGDLRELYRISGYVRLRNGLVSCLKSRDPGNFAFSRLLFYFCSIKFERVIVLLFDVKRRFAS